MTGPSSAPPAELPADPGPVARAVFGDALPIAARYAELLAGDGVAHGHVGPREIPRLWERHLVNSALVADLVPGGARLVDVGSGAGLPGLPVAIRRPDLTVVLVEPMLRRTRFLERAVTELELRQRVSVLRGRAEDPAVRAEVAPARFVTARAVAPLDRLLAWCLPLVEPGGEVLALKGSTAADELRAVERSAGRALRGQIEAASVEQVGERYGADTTFVVRVVRSASVGRRVRRA